MTAKDAIAALSAYHTWQDAQGIGTSDLDVAGRMGRKALEFIFNYEPKNGRWIRSYDKETQTTKYVCSVCGDYHAFREDHGEYTFNGNFFFCRRCGSANSPQAAEMLRKIKGDVLQSIEQMEELERTESK